MQVFSNGLISDPFSEGALGKDFLNREKLERQKKAATKSASVGPKRPT